MHMENVEIVGPANFRHLHGQGQRVVRVFEQPINIDRHGMVEQNVRVGRQTKRPLIADEVHLMSAPRQFLPEGGRQDAAAADRRVTGDAN